MNAKTALEIVRLVEEVIGKGKPGDSPQTLKIDDREITVNSINTSTESGYELQWSAGDQDFTARIVANSPFGKITEWK